MSTSPLVRPLTRARTTAAALNAALAVAALVLAVPALYHGAGGSGGGVPFVANIEDVALGALGLLGSGAVLRRQRWGTVLVIVVRAVDGLPSILGLLTPVSTSVRISAAVSVVGAAVVIYLLLRRQPT